MKIGISTVPTDSSIDMAILAQSVEELGFESLWLPDQPVLPVKTVEPVPREWGDIVDPLIALSRASVVTSRLKLGTAVLVVTERNPITLAKEVATLDMYSGGRYLFGVGVGSIEEEAAILGSDFPHRWTQAHEAVLAMKELWTKEVCEFHGRYYDFPPVYCFPKPVQRPHPPIILGGHAPNVFKRIVAWGEGWIPIGVTPDQVQQGRATLDSLAQLAARDPKSIQISVVGVPADIELIERFEEAGADRVIILLATAREEESVAQLEGIAAITMKSGWNRVANNVAKH